MNSMQSFLRSSNNMPQTATGQLTENRVIKKLTDLSLTPLKPSPDRGIDIEVRSPNNPNKVVNIQVKGRNPNSDRNWRWFQVRVSSKKLLNGKKAGIDPNQLWKDQVNKVDFFILDVVKHDEMWVLPKNLVFELIRLNETVYGERPDNVFNYDEPLKQKQKEMNLDIEVDGQKLTERFKEYRDNFKLILDAFTLNTFGIKE